MRTILSIVLVLFFGPLLALSAGPLPKDALVELQGFQERELRSTAFELDVDQEVEIETVGYFKQTDESRILIGYAWILDSSTREMAWMMEPEPIRKRDRKPQEQRTRIRLPRGSYELYYSSFPYIISYDGAADGWWSGSMLSRVFEWAFSGEEDGGAARALAPSFRVSVRGSGRELSLEEAQQSLNAYRKKAAVAVWALTDGFFEARGFALDRPMKLELLFQGEAPRKRGADSGWIIDAVTRKKVWEFEYDRSDSAGGAEKNRRVRRSIRLPKGKYAVLFSTDDSHSPRGWNSPPPIDPETWGLQIWPSDDADRTAIRGFDYQRDLQERSLVALTRVGDDQFSTEGFSLSRPMQVTIYALGESRSRRMRDYGWIFHADAGRIVWRMNYRSTKHAGGARKNRVAEESILLEPGNYVAYYRSDDSHSFRKWNSAPPIDAEAWGLRVLSQESDFSPAEVSRYREEDDPSILARILEVPDDASLREDFALDRDRRLTIYAIGEGSGGRMHDYAWIEDAASGDVVWKMEFASTEHAGGASKNRVARETVNLPAGKYRLRYDSDDSHSFVDWNASPPFDQAHWGVTVRLIRD